MSKKGQLKKAIGESEREIEALEKKRTRSQSALMTAMLKGEKPDATDAEYFKVFTTLIDNERENLKKMMEEYKALGGKID